jgi:hypothetical protein
MHVSAARGFFRIFPPASKAVRLRCVPLRVPQQSSPSPPTSSFLTFLPLRGNERAVHSPRQFYFMDDEGRGRGGPRNWQLARSRCSTGRANIAGNFAANVMALAQPPAPISPNRPKQKQQATCNLTNAPTANRLAATQASRRTVRRHRH